MWVALPIPAEAKLSSPGFSFVALTRSVTVFQDFDGDTTNTFGSAAKGVTPVKSFNVS